MTRNEKYIAAFQPHIGNEITHFKTIAPNCTYAGLMICLGYVYIGIQYLDLNEDECELVGPNYIYDEESLDQEEQMEIAQGITGLSIETVRKIFEDNNL